MAKITLTGSCLCQAVTFEVRGEPVSFYHCHCRRCRKATGTGHSSNIICKAEGIKWLSGEERVNRYKLAEAKRFASWFCRECGSALPRYDASMNTVVIPAGSLDCEPPIEAEARIFWGSRANWSCSNRELPQFDEYPG